VQAAQVRKSSFVTHEEEKRGAYHPETHHSCTIHAGTSVQQASYTSSAIRRHMRQSVSPLHHHWCMVVLPVRNLQLLVAYGP